MCRNFLIGSDTIVICKVLHCLWSLDTKELFISWFPWFPFPLLPLSISQAGRRGYGASLCVCVCVFVHSSDSGSYPDKVEIMRTA